MRSAHPDPHAQEGNAHFKDAVLHELASHANVASFVSFGPADLRIRFACLPSQSPTQDAYSAVTTLIESATSHSVNVRSFDPFDGKSRDFIYGLQKVDEVFATIEKNQQKELYSIVNETIDIHDGGVSGVTFGGVCEFAPDDTPRAVEKPGILSMEQRLASRLIETVYGFDPQLNFEPHLRTEFSVHPLRCGVRREHVLVWEVEEFEEASIESNLAWPNRFSRFLGDKAFGLLVGHLIGLPVPRLTVIGRRIGPFTFGSGTGTGETWIRTCPTEQKPGLFTTHHGWLDPWELFRNEDPDGTALASVIAQEGVDAEYSGAAVATESGDLMIEGVSGWGDAFMQGEVAPQPMPLRVETAVRDLHTRAREILGPIRMEWAFDGSQAWILQLHLGATPSQGHVIYPGQGSVEHRFDVSEGIGSLRELIEQVEGTGEGILLVGSVGITSHLGDLLRRAKIPSRIERPERSWSED